MNVKEAIERLRRDVQTMELIKDVGSVSFHGDDMTSHRDDIRIILDLIDKLPKTADGVPMTPGMMVYGVFSGAAEWNHGAPVPRGESYVQSVRPDSVTIEKHVPTNFNRKCFYSTREAALAAKEANE